MRVLLTLILISVFQGCALRIDSAPGGRAGAEYPSKAAYRLGDVVEATVVQSRSVWIPADKEDVNKAATIGAIAASGDAVLNSNVSDTVLRGAAGSVVGGAIGSIVGKTNAVELLVRLGDGRMKFLVQPWDGEKLPEPGSKVVLVINAQKEVRAIQITTRSPTNKN